MLFLISMSVWRCLISMPEFKITYKIIPLGVAKKMAELIGKTKSKNSVRKCCSYDSEFEFDYRTLSFCS